VLIPLSSPKRVEILSSVCKIPIIAFQDERPPKA
jgi:hypothetical protein